MTRPSSLVWTCLLVLVGSLLMSACVTLPTRGPVVESDVSEEPDLRQASDIDARPPAPGASRSEVVSGFLDAMTAWPIQTTVAKQYLTSTAAGQWDPERETIVYSDVLPVREHGGTVSVELTAASSLDAGGAWQGSLPAADLVLELRVTVENGEYRIADPRDALLVPARWFQQRYRQVSLYYFDPLAQILVPEPVFVPAGDQLATSLVAGLLAGPPPRARGVVRSFLPTGLSVGLSVPVDPSGIARIALVGNARQITAGETELMLAQLAWTLRQDRSITALRVTIDGTDLPLPGGAARYPVSGGAGFDPVGADSTSLLFGTSTGRLIWGTDDNLAVAAGPFGADDAGLVAVAARPDGEVVAVLDDEGRRVRIGEVRASDDPPRTVLSGGRYARPTWDAAGRLWVLEPRADGAVVWLVVGEDVRQVRVPGITGEAARQLLVSRDGTRLVAVVRTAAGDAVLGARVVIDGRGGVAQTGAPFLVRAARQTRIEDLAWTSPIRVALLTPTAPGSISEIDVVAADGATAAVDEVTAIVAGPVLGLAGDPTGDSPIFAVYADGLLDIVKQDEHEVTDPLTQLDYPG